MLNTPETPRRDGRLVRALGNLSGGSRADAVLGGNAKHGGAGKGTCEPGEEAGHVGGHSGGGGGGEDGEECDDECDECCGCEA